MNTQPPYYGSVALYRLNALVHKGMYRTSLGKTPDIDCLRLEHPVNGWNVNLYGDGTIEHWRSRDGEIAAEDERAFESFLFNVPQPSWWERTVWTRAGIQVALFFAVIYGLGYWLLSLAVDFIKRL